MKHRLSKLVSSLFIVSMLLSACGAPGATGVAISEVQTYWANTVTMENHAEADWLSMLTTRSEGFQNVVSQNPLIDKCFVDSAQALEDAVSGRYDTKSEQGQPTGNVQAGLLLDALSINENYPDLSVCQGLVTKIANDITTWRLKNIDMWNKIWDDKQGLDTQYYGELGRALANQLLQYAGTEFMKSTLAQQFAPPKIWFPTFNLEAFVTDPDQCNAFITDYPGQARWSNSLKRCQLIGQAAYDIIFRPILSSTTLNEVNTGVDSSNPVATMAPVPTATK